MPSPLPRQVRWNGFAHYCSIDVGLPQLHGGSAPALIVSRPAQRSLPLWPARSPSRLATLYIESSDWPEPIKVLPAILHVVKVRNVSTKCSLVVPQVGSFFEIKIHLREGITEEK